MRRPIRVDGADRRHAVPDPPVVKQHGLTRIAQDELVHATSLVDNPRRPRLDVESVNEHDERPIDAVAVHPLQRRQSGSIPTCLDPELMKFAIPARTGSSGLHM